MRQSPRDTQNPSPIGPPPVKTALIAPRPLDALELPPDLDGRDGTNRARGHAQIAARDDLTAVRAWLTRVADRKTTFGNYRKEAERLLLW